MIGEQIIYMECSVTVALITAENTSGNVIMGVC
jgi:hypothetical protein